MITLTIMTVKDMVRRDTPPKKAAAPIRAKAPGSIQAQYGSKGQSNISIINRPIIRPIKPPINLKFKKKVIFKCNVI